MITNLVLSGGAQRGYCYVGVIRYLEEIGILNNIKNIMGVSIGSLFSLIIALKINYKQIGNLLTLVNTDMGEININSILSFFDTYGIDNGERINKLVKACIKVKLGNENATFNDLHNYNSNMTLLISATNLTYGKRTIFSYEDTPNVELWKAVRASCSYPLYFHPVKIDDDLYVDGGVSCNYPIDYFKSDIDNTIGIIFNDISEDNGADNMTDNMVNYISSIFKVIISGLERHIISFYKEYTITINVPMEKMLDYKMSRETKEEFYEIGYNEFKREWIIKFPDDIPSETSSNYNEDWENELEDIRSHIN